MKRRGFTLIESLAVIAIIGILASLTIVSVSAIQRQARDTKRKADLTAISFGFEARFNDRTCNISSEINTYPVYGLEVVGNAPTTTWGNVAALAGLSDSCGPFSNYLKTIPADRNPSNPYKFNISGDMKHFRLAALLEKTNPPPQSDLAQQNLIWQSLTYPGKDYGEAKSGSPSNDPYNYFIGR